MRSIHDCCEAFEKALRNDKTTSIEQILESVPDDIRTPLFRELLAIELEWLDEIDILPAIDSFLIRFPDLHEDVQQIHAEVASRSAKYINRHGRSQPSIDVPQNQPTSIGRYRVEKRLGSGGFGVVYLAHDEELNRSVAIKVPHARSGRLAVDAEHCLIEARTLALLDHSNIAPVYDIARDEQFPYYIVSKYIHGQSLSARLKENRLNYLVASNLVATIAEALQAAHKLGVVHRDVKPGNILIDSEGKPYLVDFGLALHEENLGSGPKYAGTPAYMSPEQARGEGHRVDGRSDIFSLGVVFYELLAGRPPFRGDTQSALLNRVTAYEPRPIRQFDERVPIGLERICFKAISKRASDRYSSAHDMAVDLRQFLAENSPNLSMLAGNAGDNLTTTVRNSDASPSDSSPRSPVVQHDSNAIPIVPKGLRSFDESDAEFFLQLLPGPRDRHGLPDNIRFWKTCIEQTDADHTFPVGLLFGPSGCGKSSLVKAGLLPILAKNIISVYLEATAEGTEVRLVDLLRKRVPGLPHLSLIKTISAIRTGQGIATGQKVLIVIDQFEQWLHAKREEENTELLQALRQCDGSHVQCIVMVRDDFWLAVSRFMRDMEVDLVTGKNTALVDLFDLDHAQRVLRLYGQAFGRLPQSIRATTRDQESFLKKAIQGLAKEGKVVCVRLAIFADMMKSKDWTPSSWKQSGGAEGIGTAFLEETFISPSANPMHRFHQQAVRSVLAALLPETSIDIKGQMRSYKELLVASGYEQHPKDFEALIRILDSDLRLITPTDRIGWNSQQSHTSPVLFDGNGKLCSSGYYQLTHDYLVPTIRDWLSSKQRETQRGRAELRLAELSAMWNAKPENRRLPTTWEWGTIRYLTKPKTWTMSERRMMNQADRSQSIFWSIGLAILFLVGFAFQQWTSSIQHRHLIQRAATVVATMANSRGSIVPLAIKDLESYPSEIILKNLNAQFDHGPSDQQLGTAYALANYGVVKKDFLIANLREVSTIEFENLLNALSESKSESLTALQKASENCNAEKDWSSKQRFAIIALHLGDPSLATEMCQPRPDPIQRTIFIDQLPTWLGDPIRLANVAKTLEAPATRSAICLGVGNTPTKWMSTEARIVWKQIVADWFQNESDSETHSAARWTLQKWVEERPQEIRSHEPIGKKRWYVNPKGITLLKVEPGSFTRKEFQGPYDSHQGPSKMVTLTHGFFLADREVSVGQFQQMMDDPDYPSQDKPRDLTVGESRFSPTSEHPIIQANGYDGMLFCNWLSAKESLPPAYERYGDPSQATGDFLNLRFVPGSLGYRMPTEAEWEYACRAGTVTDYPSGDDVRFVQQYTVMLSEITSVGGSKFPNAWGFFDLPGNAMEWCEDWDGPYGDAAEVIDPTGPASHPLLFRVLRGGNFESRASWVRSASRTSTAISVRLGYGFRVARTVSASGDPLESNK